MNRPAPDFEARVYTPHRIAAVVDTLVEDGVAPAHALAGSGIEETALRSPDMRVSLGQIAVVFRNALRLAPDPTIALRAGARMRITSYGMYGYALLSSPTAAAAADLSVRYHPVAAPGVTLAFSREGLHAVFRYEVLLTPDPADALYRFMLEFSYSAHLALSRDLYDREYGFAAVRASYAAPAHAEAYRQFLHCPAYFGQPFNEVELDPARLDRAPRSPDTSTHAMAREMCHQLLADLTHTSGTASLVRRALVEQRCRGAFRTSNRWPGRCPWRRGHCAAGSKPRELPTATSSQRCGARWPSSTCARPA
ncbi:AraC family transcriptional regulator [Variovorax sp. J22R133]|uniref:AraC family transcriptional regulator n=1 Tax=Variovorax brevis TaxID=3053503 RepID=UPI002574A1AF|nr:AraC family transcriptional regulator [Variovorax sp. J22R133]MDM0117852.1 AraC family transcriptional regulator [Variovorax sp. J22R133]